MSTLIKKKTHISVLKNCVIHGASCLTRANTLISHKQRNNTCFILVTQPVIGHFCLRNKLIMQTGHFYSAVNSMAADAASTSIGAADHRKRFPGKSHDTLLRQVVFDTTSMANHYIQIKNFSIEIRSARVFSAQVLLEAHQQ